MATLDVFHQDPFRTITLTAAIEKVPYLPDGLEAMKIFEDKPIRTEELWVEQRQGQLVLVPFSDRGAPGTQRTTELRNARPFKVPRIRMEDTITARELMGIRQFGSETELMQVQQETMRRFVGPTGLRANLRYTQEFHRLAAVQGLLLDATGAVKYNWFNEFGITPNAEVPFNLLAKTAGTLRPLAASIARAMKRKSQGAWTASTRIQALCGDAFWDALSTHPDVTATYLNWYAAVALRGGLAFESMPFADIEWLNYRGSDDTIVLSCAAVNGEDTITVTPASLVDLLANGWNASGPGLASGTEVSGTNSETGVITLSNDFTGTTGTYSFNFGDGVSETGAGAIGIPSNKAIFFPKGAPGVFQRALSPGDAMEFLGTLGKPEYARVIPDRDRNEWVKLELDNYPLHICTRPEMLFTATMDAAAN